MNYKLTEALMKSFDTTPWINEPQKSLRLASKALKYTCGNINYSIPPPSPWSLNKAFKSLHWPKYVRLMSNLAARKYYDVPIWPIEASYNPMTPQELYVMAQRSASKTHRGYRKYHPYLKNIAYVIIYYGVCNVFVQKLIVSSMYIHVFVSTN